MKALGFLILTMSFSLGLFAMEEAIVNYPLMKDIKEHPKECWFSGEQSCLIKTDFHSKYPIEVQSSRVILGSQSAVLRRSGEIHLVKGEFWVKGNIVLNTEFGKVDCKNCEAYIFRSKKEVHVRSLAGDVFLHPKNLKDPIYLPRYMENWIAGVRIKNGHAESGIPQPIAFRDHVKTWAKFYNGTKSEFKKEVEDFRKKWAYKVHESSEALKNRSQRKIASVIAEKQKRKEAKKKQREADKVFRDMLRRRALFE
jgi:hypothetical protein